mmetsp:Transcript_21797/g.45570  ORF Transcript_21797/g.45570 Transcript_21797/m.45570 type:complete len:379 (-) Transcript_21797:203-1339(-)
MNCLRLVFGHNISPKTSSRSSKLSISLPIFLLTIAAIVPFLSPSKLQSSSPNFVANAFSIKPHHLRPRHHPSQLTMSATTANAEDKPTHKIRAGFVGCGTIASSIATSLAKPAHQTHLAQNSLALSSIHVTRRSESKSKALKENFPDVVTVCETAEEVVRNSDLVFLCVLPQHVEGVLGELKEKGVWRKGEHTLVSLVSTSKVDDLIQKTSLPPNHVYKMICLPPIANREGCVLLQPPASNSENGLPFLKSMLDALGGCVECPTDDVMNAMMIPGCMMGSMYGVMRNTRDWLVNKGVPPQDASYFVGRSYLSIVQDAERNCNDPHRFDELIAEQTPGGLNEQGLRNLEKQGVFERYDRAMDAILSRLEGKTDGNLDLE